MAEESENHKSSRSKFLSRSKWGKVFKENDQLPAPGKVNSFKLNEDVVDFLKPSTDRVASTKPKINVAVAQRWPDAHELRRVSEAQSDGRTPVNGWTKPRRRDGLVVCFVKTAPEIIGEGGDDAGDPPTEVSRNKSRMARSVSDRRPGSLDNGAPGPGIQMPQTTRKARAPSEPEFKPQPIRRVQTSHNEFSPAVQRKHASPPMEDVIPHRPSLGRIATGFDDDPQRDLTPLDNDHHARLPPMPPSIRTQFNEDNELSPHDSGISSQATQRAKFRPISPSPVSPAVRRQRDMMANEGMALRRASALYMNDEYKQDPNEGWKPSTDFYNVLSQPSSEPLAETLLHPQSNLSATTSLTPRDPSPGSDPRSMKRRSGDESTGLVPLQGSPKPSNRSAESAISPVGRSPFADPKYIKRHSRETILSVSAPTLAAAALREDMLPDSGQTSGPPFADLNYGQDHPGESELAKNLQQHLGGPSPRQQLPTYQPSYMQPLSSQIGASYMQPHSKPAVSAAISPSYMRAAQPVQYQQGTDTRSHNEQSSYLRAIQPPSGPVAPGLQATMASQNITVPKEKSSRDPPRSPMHDRPSDNEAAIGILKSHTSQLERPGVRVNQAPTRNDPLTDRRTPRDSERPSGSHGMQTVQSQRYLPQSGSYESNSPHSTMLSPSGRDQTVISPKSCGSIPADYFAGPRQTHGQPARSPAAFLRQEESTRPGSSSSIRSGTHPSISPLPPTQGDPSAELALADFAGRVAHMKGVFRLTAEKERPADRCTPTAWLRTAIWWYLRGKSGLENLLQQRTKSQQPHRELLMQPHVDLAKAWWIISDLLEQYDISESTTPQSAQPNGNAEEILSYSVTLLRSYLRSLSASMQKSQLMPPHQSLIQGQDTQIWLEYPNFVADAVTVLGGGGGAGQYLIKENTTSTITPLEAIPLGDTRDMFCYTRFLVEISINTDDAETDRVMLPCMLSILRSRREYQTRMTIASQSELINITVGPKYSKIKGLTWSNVSWKARSNAMIIHLPLSFDMTVRMQERDFRSLWNLVEYSRKVEHSIGTEPGEKLVHETSLSELQYADSSGASNFPQEKIKKCNALVFERFVEHSDGSGVRKAHSGFRLLLVTEPVHKSLCCVSHDLCRNDPLFFELLTDAAANGTTAMVIRIREEKQQCRILLVFPDIASRHKLYDVLNGLAVGPDEVIVGKMALAGVNIQAASQTEGLSSVGHASLQALQWQKLGVTNQQSDDPNTRIPPTVESESLRIVARHAGGCITDRLNLGKGEMLLRLPCADKLIPALQMLRQPQSDLTMSIDTRQYPQHVTDGISELMRLVQEGQTIRTFTFATTDDLHAFEAAITGFAVLYDGVASSFSISRRMMVVSIHHKWNASNVRLQVVSQGSVVKVLAFMEDFSHADALCFQVKPSDVFENVKGDNKNKKWAIKMKEAKFSLPGQKEGKEDVDTEEKSRRRFVNLEGLDYAEEHDDITVGFDTEEGEFLEVFGSRRCCLADS